MVNNEKHVRPSWDEFFMTNAFVAAQRSTCYHHHIGAVITLDNQSLTEGYNSTAPEEINCLERGYCLKEKLSKERNEEAVSGKGVDDCPAIHAEANAIYQASKLGISLKGSKMYSTHQPCFQCANAISSAGIVEVKYVFPYADKRGLELFSRKGIKCNQIEMPDLKIKVLK